MNSKWLDAKRKLQLLGEDVIEASDLALIAKTQDDTYKIYKFNADGTIDSDLSKKEYSGYAMLLGKDFLSALNYGYGTKNKLYYEMYSRDCRLNLLNGIDGRIDTSNVYSDYPLIAIPYFKRNAEATFSELIICNTYGERHIVDLTDYNREYSVKVPKIVYNKRSNSYIIFINGIQNAGAAGLHKDIHLLNVATWSRNFETFKLVASKAVELN